MDINLRDGGRYMLPCRMEKHNGRLFFDFPFSDYIRLEIKAMRGTYYSGFPEAHHREYCKETFGKDQIWSVEDCPRNRFQLQFLMGGDPYRNWDKIYEGPGKFRDETRAHQWDLTSGWLAVHYQIWAAQMGVGKTLALIEAMEHSGTNNWWYVGPKAAILAVEREWRIWESKVIPEMMTYDGLKKRMKEWPDGKKTPQFVCFDEFSKCKGITTETSQAAQARADGIRSDWGWTGGVLGMSGTPAPKSPADWYSLCEIVYPGFIKEGNIVKFTQRLAVCEKVDGVAGQQFKKLKWRDDPKKCDICGILESEHEHGHEGKPNKPCTTCGVSRADHPHAWKESINEVFDLAERMKGLVKVLRIDDCMELPEKIFTIKQCKVSPDIARIAQMILSTESRAAEALIKLRQLSDGFQYEDKECGTKECDLCHGTKLELAPVQKENGYDFENQTCSRCAGTGVVPKFVRSVREIPCPKDDVLRELIDMHFDIGRVVIFAGFEASIDKCERICTAKKWSTIRWDGRGIKILDPDGTQIIGDPLELFQNKDSEFDRIAFLGQAGAAGKAVTLTASPSEVYYSNTFNGEDREQSESRIRRFGCNGANYFDICHLPTDRYILKNLREKRALESLSMGEVIAAMKA